MPPPESPNSPGTSPQNGLRSQPQLKLAPAAPSDRKEAAKEAFLDTVLNAKSILEEMVEDFRASDRFFKYKAGVLGGWVLLSVLTLFIACPSASSLPSNSLSAEVKANTVAALDSSIPVLLIRNASEEGWTDVRLTLNGQYTMAVPEIRANGQKVVEIRKFQAADGKPPPDGTKASSLEIRCSAGSTTVELTP